MSDDPSSLADEKPHASIGVAGKIHGMCFLLLYGTLVLFALSLQFDTSKAFAIESTLAQRLDAVDLGESPVDDWRNVASVPEFWSWFHNLMADFHGSASPPEALSTAACPGNSSSSTSSNSTACAVLQSTAVPNTYPEACLQFLGDYVASAGRTGATEEQGDLGGGSGGYLDPHTRIVSGIALSVSALEKGDCPSDRFSDISRTCFTTKKTSTYVGAATGVQYAFSSYSDAFTRLFDMGMYATAAESVVCEAKTLELDAFVQDGTNHIAVYIPVYNAALDLFAVAILNFYPSADERFRVWREFRSVPLRGGYSDSSSLLRLFLEIPILLMLVVYTGIECRKLFRRPRRYFTSWWTLVEGGFCVISWAMVAQWIAFAVETASNPLDIPKELRSTSSWEKAFTNVLVIVDLADQFEHYKITAGLLMMAILLKMFRFLSLNRRLDLVAATLSAAARDLAHFAVVLVLIVCMYAFAGVIVFGHIAPSYRSFWWAGHALLRAAWLDMDFQELWEAQPVTAVLYFYSYIALVSILLFNVLLSLTVDTFIRVQEQWGDAESAVQTIMQYGSSLKRPLSRKYELKELQGSARPAGPPSQATAK